MLMVVVEERLFATITLLAIWPPFPKSGFQVMNRVGGKTVIRARAVSQVYTRKSRRSSSDDSPRRCSPWGRLTKMMVCLLAKKPAITSLVYG